MRLFLLRGRSESRVPIVVPVYLARASLPQSTELAIAADVGEHGLGVVTTRYWRPGEVLQISSISQDFSVIAKVAYCWRKLEHSFHTGLVLHNPGPCWWERFLPRPGRAPAN
jgi:hypothetical protein